MGMLNKFRSYILEEEFLLNVYKNKVNVVNYINIDHFDSEKIIIRHKEGYLVIKGEGLTLSKMMRDEVLVLGEIKNLELR